MLRQSRWTFPNALDAEAARLHIDTQIAPGRAKGLSLNFVEVTAESDALDAWIIEHGGVKP